MNSSQKRLTRIVIILTLIGSVALGLLWWDSRIYYTRVGTGSFSLTVAASSLEFETYPLSVMSVELEYIRLDLHEMSIFLRSLFPKFKAESEYGFHAVNIPIYLLILTYLATLLLIWLVLLNRLARQEIQKSYHNPDTSIPR